MTVAGPVTTLWVDPDSPRAVDAAMLRQRPDSAQWLAALDAHADEGPEGVGAGRLGLHGRVHSQLLQGEPVQVVGAKGYSWTEVVCPWQPCSTDPRGYRGWLPAGHLRAVKGAAEELVAHGPVPSPAAADAVAGTVHPALALARRHLGAVSYTHLDVYKRQPFTMALVDGIAAIAAGNAVISKPDHHTPLSALLGLQLIEEAGFPTGLWQMVAGQGRVLGTPMIANADYVCFTGSTATGKAIAGQCAERLIGCSLELGGKNPILVLRLSLIHI